MTFTSREVLNHALTQTIKPVAWTCQDEAQFVGLMIGTPPAQMPEGGSAAH